MTVWPKLPVYVLSVRSFESRQASINLQASRFGFEPQYIFEFDVADMAQSDFDKFDEAAQLPAPSMSLVLKHLRAMELILESDAPYALILEDDAEFFHDAVQRFYDVVEQVPTLQSPWLVFLGGADNKLDERFLSDPAELIASPVTTTEALILDREGCRLRLEFFRDHLIDRPADHLFQKLDPELGISHYRVADPLFSQGSITGKFDTELDASRRKHSKQFIRAKYWFNRFRRQLLPRLIRRIRGGK